MTSKDLVDIVWEDEHYRGLAALVDAIYARRRAGLSTPPVAVRHLTAQGNGNLLALALRVVRDGLPDEGGRRPIAVAAVADADRAFQIDRATRSFEARPKTTEQLQRWVEALRGGLQHTLRERTYDVVLRERLFAFPLCWAMESVALSDPARFATIANATSEGAASANAYLAQCTPSDPRTVAPDEFPVVFQKPADCFRELYRLTTGMRPSKTRVDDVVSALAHALPRDDVALDVILARVPGLRGLVEWVATPRTAIPPPAP